MALTINYPRLATAAPGKKKAKARPRGKQKTKPATKEKPSSRWVYPSHPPAPGTKRYTLSLPNGRYHDALAAGCHFDQDSRVWYIDNPKNLNDFAAWKPRLLGFDKKVKALKTLLSPRDDM